MAHEGKWRWFIKCPLTGHSHQRIRGMRQLLAPAAHVLQTTLLAVSATFEITRNQFYSSYPHLMYIYVLNYDIYNYIYNYIYILWWLLLLHIITIFIPWYTHYTNYIYIYISHASNTHHIRMAQLAPMACPSNAHGLLVESTSPIYHWRKQDLSATDPMIQI